MRAVVQSTPNDPSTLMVGSVPVPVPGNREILIRVQCSAINRMDLLQVKGAYPVPAGASNIIGVEVSGTVAAIGPGCLCNFQVNETVAALLPGGGYAEYCVVDERTVIRSIGKLDMKVLAAVPEAFMTSYQLCFLVGNIQPGEAVLLHAAASSVGQAAIQMLVRKGCKVFTTVRSEDKVSTCEQLGAIALNVGNSALFSEAIRERNGGKGVNVILDPVGASYMDENIKSLEVDGRVLIYGLMGGAGITDSAGFLGKFLAKRLTLLTSTLRSRSVEYKEELLRRLSTDKDAGFPALASGEMKVDVDRTFPLEEVLQAHEYVAKNLNTGKVVLLI
jgi:tumor protein p53-inducible protein 3